MPRRRFRLDATASGRSVVTAPAPQRAMSDAALAKEENGAKRRKTGAKVALITGITGQDGSYLAEDAGKCDQYVEVDEAVQRRGRATPVVPAAARHPID